MDQIVFICTGNTCRSPMAEGVFRALGGEEKDRTCGAERRDVYLGRPSGERERGHGRS